MSDLKFKITPEEFLREIGVQYKRREKWLSLRICPFCYGGHSEEKYSLSIHIRDGNFFCHRAKSCGERGSFWKLIESFGNNPRDYLERQFGKSKKKRKLYGQQESYK